MTMPFNDIAGWVWSVDDAGGVDAVIATAKAAGLSSVFVKVAHGTSFGDGDDPTWSRDQFLDARDALHAAGLRVLSWSYLLLDAPQEEALIAGWALANGADGHIFNCEGETFGKDAEAALLGQIVRAEYPTAFLAYAPLCALGSVAQPPYAAMNGFCDAVMPHFYSSALGLDARGKPRRSDKPFPRLFADWREKEAAWRAAGVRVPQLRPVVDGWMTISAAGLPDFLKEAQVAGVGGFSVYYLDRLHDAMIPALAGEKAEVRA